ncbi:MAG: LicD family protein [Oscillospiraceae bacterium]|nr:LicD family protein [Oscillospiraceae bacterium]
MDIREIQLVELDMLKAFSALCERHGLRYTIYCGTLLGAVRHGGFIPWDDDVDVAMPLPDYRRFLTLAHELPDRFHVQALDNTREYHFLYAKICADGTTFMPPDMAGLDIHWGISLDIYPFIGAARDPRLEELQRKLLKMARYLRSADWHRFRPGKHPRVEPLLIATPFPIRRVLSDLLLRIAMRDPDKSERIGTLDAVPFSGKFSREEWQKMIRLPFEDTDFPAPAQFDPILRRMYGDYRQLPPEKDRHGHSDDTQEYLIDTKRDYRLYQQDLKSHENSHHIRGL